MIIIGLGGLLGDAACALLRDGALVAAAEEGKIARRHTPGGVPAASIGECLRMARVTRDEVNCVAIVRPFSTRLESHFHLSLRALFPKAEIALVEHHAAHAASAYYASAFEEATVLTLDHSGDFRCGARWRASGHQIALDREWYYPDSLGRLYGAVTEFLGFRPGAHEHKVQWLSTSGDDRFVGLFREILSAAPRLDSAFFDGNRVHQGGFGAKFYERLGLADEAVPPESLKPHVARGVQKAVEEAVLSLAGSGENLCVAGGLFYNVLLVESLETSARWKNVFVQAAAGNAGTALGAVFHAWHHLFQRKERCGRGSLLVGPAYTVEEIKQVLENCKLRFRYLSSEELVSVAVGMIVDHKIVAWMQGPMEFGPRALGNRSILASPLNAYSTENLNIYIKHREPFRKFAASVPAELAAEYFETGPNSRHLATMGRVKEKHRKTFASAILGENAVRVHTVDAAENPLFHRLLMEAGKRTGLPVLYNTSFNLFGDPLVATPRDAVRSFYSSGIDALFVGNFLLEK